MLLSVESSCDDSAIALTSLASKELIYHAKLTQDEHAGLGGVVPELASRAHARDLVSILQELVGRYDLRRDVKAIAVSTHPGLSLTLLEGLMMANTLSIALSVPIISVNHLIGHIYSPFINNPEFVPHSALLISGGHTMLVRASGLGNMHILGASLDDSLGESYDKVARMLGLPYPGGPYIERLAASWDKALLNMPRPLLNSKGNALNFSYSGLKNAVRLAIARQRDTMVGKKQDLVESNFHLSGSTGAGGTLSEIDSIDLGAGVEQSFDSTSGAGGFGSTGAGGTLSEMDRTIGWGGTAGVNSAEIAASFEAAAIAHLISRLKNMIKSENASGHKVKRLGVVGGVSANMAIKGAIDALAKRHGIKTLYPEMKYCSDNAAMIGRVGVDMYEMGMLSDNLKIGVHGRDRKITELI